MGSCASRPKQANAEYVPREKPTSSKNAIPKSARGDPTVKNKAKSSDKQTSKNEHKEEPLLVDLSDPKLDGNAPSSSTDKDKSTITELASEIGVSNPDASKDQMKASNDPIKAPEVIPVEEKAGVENEVAKNEPKEEPLLVDLSDPKLDGNAPSASTDKDKSTITELVSEIGVSNPAASPDQRKASDDPIKSPEVIPVEGKAGVENEVAKNEPKEEPLLVDLSDPKLDGNASSASTDKDKSTITELVSKIGVSNPDASQDQRKSSDDPIKAPEVIPVEKAGVDNEVAKNERKEEPLPVDLSDPKLEGNAPSTSTDKDKSTITELVSLIGGLNPDASQDQRKPSDDPIKAPEGIPVEEKAEVENKSADQAKITVQPKDPQKTGDTAPKDAETEPKMQKSDVKGEGVSLNSDALEKTNAETFSTSQ
ncbi:hypothetical protein AAC387_Pa08g0691 [Persea americana]